MSDLASPILVVPLGEAEIRFYRSPLEGPDFPWHDHDDLGKCLGVPDGLRREFKNGLATAFPADVRTLATRVGITTIASHSIGQGSVDAAIARGRVTKSMEFEYVKAAAKALDVITVGWSGDKLLAFLEAAYRRHTGGRP